MFSWLLLWDMNAWTAWLVFTFVSVCKMVVRAGSLFSLFSVVLNSILIF